MFTVYKITNKLNDHFYIGYTKLPLNKRFQLHQRSKTTRMPIVTALKKYGAENFIIEEIAVFDDREAALKCEIDSISILRPHYNAHPGGTGVALFGPMNGMFGKKHTEQWKENKRQSMLGEKNVMYGKTHSPEVKESLRQMKKGHIPWNKGKTGIYSEVTLQKMRQPKPRKQKS